MLSSLLPRPLARFVRPFSLALGALALAAWALPHASFGQDVVEDAFTLVGNRVGIVIYWSRNILFTVVVGGIMWSLVGWIGTGRVQMKPVLITLAAGVFLGIAQGLLAFFVDIEQVDSDVGTADQAITDLLADD